MSKSEVQGLVKFMGDSAQELTLSASMAAPEVAKRLISEAEELMALRSNLLQRIWQDELDAQMPLPLSMKEAA